MRDNERDRQSPAMIGIAAGAVTSAIAAIAPIMQRGVIADHIRSGYPDYSDSRVDTAVMTYLVYLGAVGVVGLAGWLLTARLLVGSATRARWCAVGLFLSGGVIAITNLTIRDTSGDTGLPASVAWVGFLPVLAGMVATVLVWRANEARGTSR